MTTDHLSSFSIDVKNVMAPTPVSNRGDGKGCHFLTLFAVPGLEREKHHCCQFETKVAAVCQLKGKERESEWLRVTSFAVPGLVNRKATKLSEIEKGRNYGPV